MKNSLEKQMYNVRQKQREPNLICIQFKLFCIHPVTGKRMESELEVHQNDLLPKTLAKAYKVLI